MAGTRRATRKSSGPAAKGTQSTLAFTNNKVTKSTHIPGKPLTTLHKKAEELVEEIVKPEVAKVPEVSQLPAIAKFKTQEEERASKIPDSQIKKYWREREAERKAPRVHQGDISMEEKILRLFDMSSQYGVCYFSSPPSESHGFHWQIKELKWGLICTTARNRIRSPKTMVSRQ